ncbi:MAG TPA: hypothetical protein VIP77_11950 [Jiangellaceae bacterium]
MSSSVRGFRWVPASGEQDEVEVASVEDVAVGPDGYLYVGLGGIVRMIVPGEAASAVDGTGAGDRQTPGEDPWAGQSPGTVVTVAGTEGELARPWRVAVDESGAVCVVEEQSRRLLRLDADGKPEPVPGGVDGEPLIGVRAVAPGAGGAVHVSTDAGVDTVYPDGSMVRLAAGVQRSGQAVADGVPRRPSQWPTGI